MDPQQFEQLLNVLELFAERSSRYTITGADDWAMLLVIGGMLVSCIIAMWADLSNKLTNNRKDSKEELQIYKAENEKAHDLIWKAMRNCQEDCCPRRREASRAD